MRTAPQGAIVASHARRSCLCFLYALPGSNTGCFATLALLRSQPRFATWAGQKWAGRSVLFVGDETQMQFFQSFANIVGAGTQSEIRDATVGQSAPPGVFVDENRACRDWAEQHGGSSGLSGLDMDVEMRLCERGDYKGVRVRFIRNELLWTDSARNAAARHHAKGVHPAAAEAIASEAATEATRGAKVVDAPTSTNRAPPQARQPSLFLCDWFPAAVAAADLLVLNRGYHITGTNVARLRADLNHTFDQLTRAIHWRQGRRRAGSLPSSPLIVYRGTHASLHHCADFADPMTSNVSGHLHPVAYALRLHRANANTKHAWHMVYPHHRLDQDVANAHGGVTYLNTFTATSLRPGGRLHPNDCARWCLPGPIDEWSRLLLALIT